MTCGRVFTVRPQCTTSVRTIGPVQWRNILEWPNIAESITLQVWQPNNPRLKNVAKCIRAGIAPLWRVVLCNNAGAIENDQNNAIERVLVHLLSGKADFNSSVQSSLPSPAP